MKRNAGVLHALKPAVIESVIKCWRAELLDDVLGQVVQL